MLIKQLSIFVENRQGRMAEITQIIGDAGVDIRALSVADTGDFGILRLIVNKPDVAEAALKQAGVMFSLTDVMAVAVPDAPGEFAKAIKAVSDEGISIEYMYAFIGKSHSGAYVIMRVKNPQESVKLLQQKGMCFLDSESVYNI